MKCHYYTLGLFCLFAAACTKTTDPGQVIKVKDLGEPNPTSYIFDVPLTKVRQALDTQPVIDYEFLETRKNPISDRAHSVLNQAENANDGFLTASTGGTFHHSESYFRADNSPCLYGADFHVHVTRVSDYKTKVEIFTFRPRVYIGERVEKGPLHVRQTGIFVKACSTTIEEYMILQSLGKTLRVTNMPPLHTPASSSFREIKFAESDIIDWVRDRDTPDWAPSYSL